MKNHFRTFLHICTFFVPLRSEQKINVKLGYRNNLRVAGWSSPSLRQGALLLHERVCANKANTPLQPLVLASGWRGVFWEPEPLNVLAQLDLKRPETCAHKTHKQPFLWNVFVRGTLKEHFFQSLIKSNPTKHRPATPTASPVEQSPVSSTPPHPPQV